MSHEFPTKFGHTPLKRPKDYGIKPLMLRCLFRFLPALAAHGRSGSIIHFETFKTTIMEMQVTPTFNEVAEIELLYRSKVKPSLRPTVNRPDQAYEILRSHWDMNRIELQEQFKILLLNTANKVIGLYESNSGSSTGCLVDIRLIFACVLKANAKNLILCHNHPSGNLKASKADLSLTDRMVQAGKLLEIPVVDHLIITGEGYLSFADEGLL